MPYLKRGFMGYKAKMPVGQGIFGGYPSYSVPGVTVNKTDLLELLGKGNKDLPQSIQDIVEKKVIGGDYQVHMTERPPELVYEGALRAGTGRSGGHGYGDALEREPQAVVDDVRDEIVSAWAALNVYHVAYDTETWTVDELKTEALRAEERRSRLARGRAYSEFESEWLKKRPPADQLNYHGSWPDAQVVRPIIRI